MSIQATNFYSGRRRRDICRTRDSLAVRDFKPFTDVILSIQVYHNMNTSKNFHVPCKSDKGKKKNTTNSSKPLILEVHPSSTPLVVWHRELAHNWGESG